MTAGPIAPPSSEDEISCYVCLARISWSAAQQQPYKRDAQDVYEPIPLPDNASQEQWSRALANSYVACPNVGADGTQHFLPRAYGQFGRPVVVGFVGETSSGKSHLLAAMVQAINTDRLATYGISARPVDRMNHKRFVDGAVKPLFLNDEALNRTTLGAVTFADAFTLQLSGAVPRVLALFDVSGEELASELEAKQFLYLADALIFVADPELFASDTGQVAGDAAIGAVLDILDEARRLDQVAATVVLNKADLVRFDDPVALWLSRPPSLRPDQVLRESTDVYAYLHRRGADAWTTPYRRCSRATLHVASATGGGKIGKRYERGVSPRRVLGPLLSVLAMTKVLNTPDAEEIGR